MNRREFIFGATSIALGANAFSEILLAKGNAKGTIELLIEDAELIWSKFRAKIKK